MIVLKTNPIVMKLKFNLVLCIFLGLPISALSQIYACQKDAINACVIAFSDQNETSLSEVRATCENSCGPRPPIPFSCKQGEGLIIYDQFGFASGSSSIVDSQILIALEQKLTHLPKSFFVEVIGHADPFPFEGTEHSDDLWNVPFERCSAVTQSKDNACLATERALSVGRTVSKWLLDQELNVVKPMEHIARQDPFMSMEFERLGPCFHKEIIVGGMSLLTRAKISKAAILEVTGKTINVDRSLSESTLRGCAIEGSTLPCNFATEIGVSKGDELVEWLAPFRSVIVFFGRQ